MMEIIQYKGPPEVVYFDGMAGKQIIVLYACSQWMISDIPRVPYFCPNCGAPADCAHVLTQSLLEDALTSINCINETTIKKR